MLEGFLAWQRATLLSICAGLTAEQLAERSVPPSRLSLLGLIRHLAKVERIWFRSRAGGEQVDPMYHPMYGKNADFERLDPAQAQQDLQRLQDEWPLADAAVSGVDFDRTFVVHGDTLSLRMIYVHVIGEYARHLGHADLLRECVDGVTGR
jgi:uncharacterized damage-inducible protein DinB